MALGGLAQIDENSSLVNLTKQEPVVLPTLLRRAAPVRDTAGEKTPEAWPRTRCPCGEKTPEAWPRTPTPHGAGVCRRSCGFGDQTPQAPQTPTPHGAGVCRRSCDFGDQTPETWPEFPLSFRMEAQQPVSFQGAPAVTQNQGPALQQLFPMWPGQIMYPMGTMVFAAQPVPMNAEPLTAAAGIPMPIHQVDNSSLSIAPTVGNAPAKAGKSKPAAANKRSARTAGPGADVDDAVPAAVFVDLSILMERASRIGGGKRQR